MQLLMSGLGALIMAAICGLSAFFIIADERHGHDAHAAEIRVVPPVAPARKIHSRAVDPAPLSVAEVFPDQQIVPAPGASPYQLRMTHIDTDCPVATTGKLGGLLDEHGCSQVVRATLLAPVEHYVVTAGLFNLPDEADARAVSDQVKSLVDGGRGSFAGMAAGPGTDPVELPSAQIGWHTRGHYLVYCVIARPDGEIVRDDDPYAHEIVFDVVESYLRENVIGRRMIPSA